MLPILCTYPIPSIPPGWAVFECLIEKKRFYGETAYDQAFEYGESLKEDLWEARD